MTPHIHDRDKRAAYCSYSCRMLAFHGNASLQEPRSDEEERQLDAEVKQRVAQLRRAYEFSLAAERVPDDSPAAERWVRERMGLCQEDAA